MKTFSLPQEIGAILQEQGLTLSVAESCTGGLLSSLITSVAGCSEYYHGAVVSYSNKIKIKVLAVSAKTIEEFGAVSAETAREMAEGVRKALLSTASLSITGIAGPGGGTTDKPLGTVFIALSLLGQDTTIEKFLFKGSREEVRNQSVNAALKLLIGTIKKAS